MDMGPYLFTQPNQTQQQMNPTQPNPWFFELAWPNPTHIPVYRTPQGYC